MGYCKEFVEDAPQLQASAQDACSIADESISSVAPSSIAMCAETTLPLLVPDADVINETEVALEPMTFVSDTADLVSHDRLGEEKEPVETSAKSSGGRTSQTLQECCCTEGLVKWLRGRKHVALEEEPSQPQGVEMPALLGGVARASRDH